MVYAPSQPGLPALSVREGVGLWSVGSDCKLLTHSVFASGLGMVAETWAPSTGQARYFSELGWGGQALEQRRGNRP